MSKRVAVFGEALIDLVDQGRASYAACPGGSPFNVALALARLGHPVAFFGPLSQDRFGQQLGAVLDQAGVDLVFNERSGKPSALAIASLVDQEPEYAFYLTDVADTDVTAAALVERWPQDLALFHTGSLALLPGRAEMTFDLLEHARRQATPVSVDLNLRMGAAGDPAAYREAVMRAASLADLVKLSAEDLDALFPALPRDAAVSALRAGMRSAMLVMTDGPRGASAWFADEQMSVPGLPVEQVADTIGAGDCFQAALLSRLLMVPEAWAGDTAAIKQAMRYGSAAASLNVQRVGCQPPIADEVEQQLLRYADG